MSRSIFKFSDNKYCKGCFECDQRTNIMSNITEEPPWKHN
jgi:hypothetical protein